MTTTISIEAVFTRRPTGPGGLLHREDAYTALLDILDHLRTHQDRITTADLWSMLRTLPYSELFGSRARLLDLLEDAEHHRVIRRTTGGTVLLRTDAPSCGGPGHVWVRIACQRGAEVEITGADPWPADQLDAPGPAWWRCTGCRDNSGTLALRFHPIRQAAQNHADACRALPTPAAHA